MLFLYNNVLTKGNKMKLSRILLSAVAVATVSACGNLSKVTEAGTPEYKK